METAAGRVSQERRQDFVSDGLVFGEERGVDKCPHETAVFPVVRRASMHGGSVDSKEIPAGGGEKLFFDMKIHFSVQYVNSSSSCQWEIICRWAWEDMVLMVAEIGGEDPLAEGMTAAALFNASGLIIRNLRLRFLQSVKTVSKGNVRYL